jgi:hypothetical protein
VFVIRKIINSLPLRRKIASQFSSSAYVQTNIFLQNNSESLTWSAKSQQKVSIADCQSFSDSIDEKSAGNLNLYYFDAL